MIQQNKKIFILILVIVSFIFNSVTAFAITSFGALAMESNTGEILYEKNPDTRLVPASMTKVMTVYVVYDKIRKGELSKDTLVTCTENAARLSHDPVASNVPLIQNEKYTVDELLYAILLPSACAASTLIGEYISGTEQEFAKLMTEYAKSMTLDAYFEDASGLSDNNKITPRSMVILSNQLIKEFPDVLNYTSKTSFNFRGRKYNNSNQLLPGKNYTYKGVDGLKTGTTNAAGKCLVATSIQNNIRIIAVTMHSSTNKTRYTDMFEIFNHSFWVINSKAAYANNLNFFINDTKIQSFYCSGGKGAVILAEDLENYGFNVNYYSETKTVHLTRNLGKDTIPVTHNIKNEEKFSRIIPNNDLKVEIYDGEKIYRFSKVFDLDGYAGIYVDELASIYDYSWNEEAQSGFLELN